MAMYAIDQAKTFSTVMLLDSGPRRKFGTQEQEISKNGELKWQASLAVVFQVDATGRADTGMITVGFTGGARNPAEGIAPGTPVVLEGLKVGVMGAELTDGKVRGGKPYHAADGIRTAAQHQPKAA